MKKETSFPEVVEIRKKVEEELVRLDRLFYQLRFMRQTETTNETVLIIRNTAYTRA